MIHPIKSIISRQQCWVIKNFNKSIYSKKLKRFKNIHSGDLCFIVGNGPSLNPTDLNLISDYNLTSFGFNRIYLMFENTDWRPTYYMSQDEKMLGNCVQQVNDMDLDYKFIPIFHKYYHNININNAYYFNLKTNANGDTFFSEDIAESIGASTTVTCSAIQMAVYMGFKKIYLIGIDHNFATYTNDKGEMIHDDSIRDYFSDEYFNDKAQLYTPNLDASTRAYIVMREYCDSHGIDIYNATRGGKLEVFKRVNLDEVFGQLNKEMK